MQRKQKCAGCSKPSLGFIDWDLSPSLPSLQYGLNVLLRNAEETSESNVYPRPVITGFSL